MIEMAPFQRLIKHIYPPVLHLTEVALKGSDNVGVPNFHYKGTTCIEIQIVGGLGVASINCITLTINITKTF